MIHTIHNPRTGFKMNWIVNPTKYVGSSSALDSRIHGYPEEYVCYVADYRASVNNGIPVAVIITTCGRIYQSR